MPFTSPKFPQGQAFIAATKVKLAGKITELDALETEIVPSSSGCLKLSRTFLRNSGSSSRNKTPRWAKLISPGFGQVPPPTIAGAEVVWWGLLNGRLNERGEFFISPTELYILATSIASSKDILGNSSANALANNVLPEPGGPDIRMLWAPEAATIRALFAVSWPFMDRSRPPSSSFNDSDTFTRSEDSGRVLLRWSKTSLTFLAPTTSRPWTIWASARLE